MSTTAETTVIMTTPPKLHHTTIFSPRPSTPATPPSFPFLDTPSPQLKRCKTTASPPTPPRRPRTRQTASTGDVFLASFQSTLAAFPTPPARVMFAPEASSSVTRATPEQTKSESTEVEDKMEVDKKEEGEQVPEWTDDESDGKTVTGVPATPSTASSGWDTFWSEPPSPAENKQGADEVLTEAAKIREAYLQSKLGQVEAEVYHIENA